MASDRDAELGERLRSLRDARGLTQSDFAETLGLSRRRYQDYEAGERPPEHRLKDIARRCRVTFTWLAYGRLQAVAVIVLAIVLAAVLSNVGCVVGIYHLPEPYCLMDEWRVVHHAVREALE